MTAAVAPSRPEVAGNEDHEWISRVRRALDWWERCGQGPTSSILGSGAVEALERAMAARVGVGHALALPSATLGLRVALAAVGVGKGDEVIVPAYDWTAAVAATRSLDAVPIGVDIILPNCTINPEAVAGAIGERTKAVVVTHLLGVPADVRAVRSICDPLRIPVVEDCAQALGSELDGRPVGSIGAVGVFSFGAGKLIDAGEGGVLTTADEALWRRAVSLSQHPTRQLLSGVTNPDSFALGTRINPLAAAVAAHGLTEVVGLLLERYRSVRQLASVLGSAEGLVLPRQLERLRCAGPGLPVLVEPEGQATLRELGLEVRSPGQMLVVGTAPMARKADAIVHYCSLLGSTC